MRIAAAIIMLCMLLVSCAATAVKSEYSPGPAEKELLLRERVKMMWDAQSKGDRAAMFDLYDPFYRAKQSKEAFVKPTVTINYYDPEIAMVQIQGNVATVRVKVEYELKSFVARGRVISEPKKQVVNTETWLFVDGNWYRQFIDNISESTVANY
ncbi:MAG TPA: hypothetical protein VN328_09975 [Thermodesulfovibrionales bacterium]|nr:hypothetical protein [Thermodesulfovibrionales bacterium]